MKIRDIIAKKRDGFELTNDEIDFFIVGVTNGDIPDYQISAMLMAMYINKLTENETLFLTYAMINSGDIVDLSKIDGIKVDKHSTGGVGDKTTLITASVAASLGIPVAKMSGRGLGHTGGTIDKLESISGFRTDLSEDEFIENINNHKISIIGQSKNIAPADKRIYAIRDVTATVDNPSLIAASVMSKKIAAGSDAMVIDVKCGNGAFIKDLESAVELSGIMIDIGTRMNKQVVAIISDMDQPLGYAVGNALEIKEVVETLRGNGPADLVELCREITSQMIILGGISNDYNEAAKLFDEAINTGKAYDKFCEFIAIQGGDVSQVENPENLPSSSVKYDVISSVEGYVSEINSEEIGKVSVALGAGREHIDSKLSMGAGIVLNKKCGDKVSKNDLLAVIYTDDEGYAVIADADIKNSFKITPEPLPHKKLILAIIGSDECRIF